MSTIEDRLREALSARADLVDPGLSPPALPAAAPVPWRRPVVMLAAAATVAAIIGVVGVIATRDDGGNRPEPAPPVPVSPTPTPGDDATPLTGDLDGDGADDRVSVVDGVLTAELAAGGTATRKVGRNTAVAGLAEIGADRLAVVAGNRVFKLDGAGRFKELTLGWTPSTLIWVGEDGRLLSATAHRLRGREVLTAYSWSGSEDVLQPAADRMFCREAGEAPVPCGSGDTFVGEPGDLPVIQRGPLDAVGVGAGEVTADDAPGGPVAARLEGSTESEVRAGEVDLVVGGARIALPDGGAPVLVYLTSYPPGGGVVFAVVQSLGDSYDYRLYRYDGAALAPVEVDEVDGLGLHGGGPAGGGPYTEVLPVADGAWVTLRSQSGVDVFQRGVHWTWDGDRLVGSPLGPVCLDSLVDTTDQPGAYGTCDLGG